MSDHQLVTQPAGRRLTLIISEPAYRCLIEAARQHRRSPSAIMSLGIKLVRILGEETIYGNKLVICKPSGEPIRQVCLFDD